MARQRITTGAGMLLGKLSLQTVIDSIGVVRMFAK